MDTDDDGAGDPYHVSGTSIERPRPLTATGPAARAPCAWAVFALSLGGCDGDLRRAGCDARSLVDAHLWSVVPFADDPFAAGAASATPPVPCAAADQGFEAFGGEDSWSISTQWCDWATVEQPARVAAAAGAETTVRVWYFSQTPVEPALARLALLADGIPIWADTLPLPAPEGGLLWATFPLQVDLAAGAPITFHLDNHGSNAWNLLEVSAVGPAGCEAPDATGLAEKRGYE